MNREPLENILDKGRLEDVQKSVEGLCEREIQGILLNIKNLLAELERIKLGLFSISKRKSIQEAQVDLDMLLYFTEMTTTLQGIEALTQKGLLTSCYREMRKILENLYWVVLDDLLLLRLLKNAEKIEKADSKSFGVYLSPYGDIDKKWHEWARINNATLSNFGDLKSKIQQIAESIRLYGRINGHNWGKKRIRNALIDNLSYSSLLLFTGRNLDDFAEKDDILKPKEGIGSIPFYKFETLQEFAKMDLRITMRQLKGKSLGKSDEILIDELIKTESSRLGRFIILPYPSNEFVIQVVSKLLSLGDVANRYYGKYSYFVHSYAISWQIIPFSSILEYKIIKHEISNFCNIILKTCKNYLGSLQYQGKYSH